MYQFMPELSCDLEKNDTGKHANISGRKLTGFNLQDIWANKES